MKFSKEDHEKWVAYKLLGLEAEYLSHGNERTEPYREHFLIRSIIVVYPQSEN